MRGNSKGDKVNRHPWNRVHTYEEMRYGVPVRLVSWSQAKKGMFKPAEHEVLVGVDIVCAYDIYAPKAGYLQYKALDILVGCYWRWVLCLWRRGYFPLLKEGHKFEWRDWRWLRLR